MTKNPIKYALKSAVPSLITTLLLCGVLFLFLTKTSVNLSMAAADLPMTVGCTGLICFIVQFFTVKGSVKKGDAPQMDPVERQASYAMIGKNPVVFIIVFSVIAFGLFACIPIGTIFIFAPDILIPRFVYILFKAPLAALTSAYATFHGSVFFAAYYQLKI